MGVSNEYSQIHNGGIVILMTVSKFSSKEAMCIKHNKTNKKSLFPFFVSFEGINKAL